MSSTLKKPGNPLGLPGFFMPWPAPNCRAGLWRQKHCRHRFVNGQAAQKTSAGIFAAMGSRKRFCTWLAHKAWKAPMAAIGLPWELMVPFVCNAMCTWPVKTGAPPGLHFAGIGGACRGTARSTLRRQGLHRPCVAPPGGCVVK